MIMNTVTLESCTLSQSKPLTRSHRESVRSNLGDVELLEPLEPDEGVVHDAGDGVAREGERAQVVHRLPRRVRRPCEKSNVNSDISDTRSMVYL